MMLIAQIKSSINIVMQHTSEVVNQVKFCIQSTYKTLHFLISHTLFQGWVENEQGELDMESSRSGWTPPISGHININ